MPPTPPAERPERLARLERLLLREVDYRRNRGPVWVVNGRYVSARWPLDNADPYQALRNIITGEREETWVLDHQTVYRRHYTNAEIRECVRRVLIALTLEGP